jgi:hypothetical protein
VVLLPYSALAGQEQGVARHSDEVWGGFGVGLARRAARTCSLRPGGQREQLAQPTDVMAAQAGQLDHLDDIGPPPASKMRKRSSWEAGEAAFLPGTMLSDFLLNKASAPQSSHGMKGRGHYETCSTCAASAASIVYRPLCPLRLCRPVVIA